MSDWHDTWESVGGGYYQRRGLNSGSSGSAGSVSVVYWDMGIGPLKPHRNQINDPQWETCMDDLNARVDRMLRESALKIMGPHTD